MQQEDLRISPKRERQALAAILIFALLHGLIYIFIVPPWQHYDEPNHFEYVWLVAFRSGLPQEGDYDLTMRREVAISMLDHGFFDNFDFNLNLDGPTDKPIWIGPYQQLGEPPLYYIVASVPLSLFNFDDVATQLYTSRIVSMLFFLITVLISYGVMVEITPIGHLLRILVPLSLAMLPGFVDVMTAVNSDTVAVAVFSFFLWGGVRLIQRGFSIFDFVWVMIATVLAYFSKNTAYITIVLLPVVLILSIFRGTKLRRWSWGLLGIGAIVGLFIIFSWGDVSLWYRQTNQAIATRMKTELAPHGDYALCIEVNPDDEKQLTQVRQMITAEANQSIRGEPFTLGVWIWANEPTLIRLPVVESLGGIQSTSKTVELGTEPAFYVVRGTLPSSTDRVWVNLMPLIPGKTSPAVVCYDGIVLVKGKQSLELPPDFHNENAERGIWESQEFTNLLRNGSMEQSWPWIRPWAENLGVRFIPNRGSPSLILYALLDNPSSGWYYYHTFYNLARTFWAKFGWGHITLIGHKPYRILGVITVLGLVGAVAAFWRKRRVLPWDVLIFFAIVLLAVWGITWVRGSIYLFKVPFIPVARYAYPAIIPTMFVLNLGWLEGLEALKRWFRLPQGTTIVVYIILMLTLDIISLVSILKYYS
jgi:hypothetical protein